MKGMTDKIKIRPGLPWFPEYYEPESPHEDPRGWSFPYAGGDWPENDGWCWVWIEGQHRGSLRHRYWSESQQRFFAVPEGAVVAWRPAVETPESVAAGRKVRRNLGLSSVPGRVTLVERISGEAP